MDDRQTEEQTDGRTDRPKEIASDLKGFHAKVFHDESTIFLPQLTRKPKASRAKDQLMDKRLVGLTDGRTDRQTNWRRDTAF